MSTVPYIFAGNTGNIPLSQLDADFANVKLSVDYVIQNTQANITSVGTLTSLSVSGNITSNATISASGNVLVTGLISAAGNITGGNLLTSTDANIGANVIAGNVLSFGFVSAAGNVIGNILNANSINATDMSLTGNIVVDGNATVSGTTTFINTTNLNIADKNITIANGVSTSALIDGAGIDAGNPTVAYIRYSDANQGWTTANSFTIGTTLSVTGNVTGGNISTAGLVTATGNVTGGNIRTAGLVTATGNVTGGNVTTAGLVTATGNILTAGLLSATGNVTGGNITTAGLVSATGNVTGGNIITTGISSRYIDVSVPTYANITATGTYSLSTTNSINILIANNTGYTATLNMPANPVDGQICNFAISGNTVTLAVGTGTVLPTFAGSTTAGTGYRYVYRLSNTSWYRIG